ncbi:MAG: right-handed parallel beta-helix repeat-containing protein [Xanthomonadales bacterium]|nr:right-handed parallel beta-helix repeat-containing protein [Xanthomonadales bacterium]
MKITCLLVLLLLCPGFALATDFCPQNDSEFANATLLSTLIPGPKRILLGANKTYHLAGTVFIGDLDNPFQPTGDFTIAGGYNSDCSAIITRDAASSVLDGTGAGAELYGFSVFSYDDLTVSTLTFTHLAKQLSVALLGGQSSLRWTHVRTVDSFCITLGGAIDNDLRVDNSLFARINGSSDCDFALSVHFHDQDYATDITLINNTVTDNARGGVKVQNFGGVSRMYSNIIYGNNSTFADLDHPNTNVVAFNNIVGTHTGSYLVGSSGNSTADPKFVSATNFNLQISSPARESGFSSPPGGLSAWDIENGARVVGSVVDRGAYEADSSGSPILIVTNTNDSGAGSLRAAILDANANPIDNIIGFNISGACPRTIALNTELPPIVGNISIRGYTQSGSAANTSSYSDNATICVELVEAAGHTITNGLRFAPSPSSTAQDVSGLAIGNFATGIRFDGPISGSGVGCSIWGNFIGLAANGTTLRANPVFGIDVRGRAACAIGGDDDAQKNVIAGAVAGIRIAAEQSNYVVNNYIGTTRSGNTARGNSLGVLALSGFNQITGNVISGNSQTGVTLTDELGSVSRVSNNRIGLKAFAICIPPCAPDYNALGNGGDGIAINSGSFGNNLYDNDIAFNGGAGIRIPDSGSVSNDIRANSIYSNAGLGIDLGVLGVDPLDNDATTPPDAPNRGLNAPVLYSARGGMRSGIVSGKLLTVNDDYVIEFFASDDCDPSGHGEGRYSLGTADLTIDNATATTNGQNTFQAPITWTRDLPGNAITATVRPNHSFDVSTSEFSVCQHYMFDDSIFHDGFELKQ